MMTLTTTTREDHGDEILTRIFQADSLMPYEYFENARRKLPLEPEKHLMQAILEDAINTFRLHVGAKSGRQRKLFLDAQRWIWSKNEDWPFSFENICTVLGLDPGFLRNGLARWKEQHQTAARPASLPGSHYPAMRRAGR
jgi:hypothetical protein